MSSTSDEYSDVDGDGNGYEEWIDCDCCPAHVLAIHYDRHVNRNHKKCPLCEKRMFQSEIDKHIEDEHMIYCTECGEKQLLSVEAKQHERQHLLTCEFCNKQILKENMKKHLQERHCSVESVIGVVRSLKITDAQFNELVANKRIYACDGIIYMK